MRAAVLALALLAASPLSAHDVSRSDSKIDVDGSHVHVTLTFNLNELQSPPDSVFDTVKQHYFVTSPAGQADIALEQYSPLAGPLVRMRILYTFPADVTALDVKSTLYAVMPTGHQHMMNVRLNGVVHQTVLDARTEQAHFSGVEETKLLTVWRFTRLGVEHIFTGYDHLAFLLCLVVATTSLGALIRIVTSFTIAHSITLALATFNLVVLPARLTESLIAASIAYVAAENLLDFRAMKRYYITFVFGLIHGFGFSNVLREMDLPKSSLALSLFSFNAGVEIGQVTFVALIFPLVLDLTSSGWKRLKPAVSIVVACLAVYWFARRAFG